MRIGIDFDNTIISYDKVFNRVGRELGIIPESLERGKEYVRDYLRSHDREEEWTRLQGYVYGTQLSHAEPYPDVNAFIEFCRVNNIPCFIVSHKTQYPYSGERYDLHEAAWEWINARNWGVEVYFEKTKEDKVKRIRDLDCSIFIDDLPEFLSLPGFPQNTVKILFDPLGKHLNETKRIYAGSWDDIRRFVMNRHGQ